MKNSLKMSSNKPAKYYVSAFNMQAHPEGGYFAETYRSSEKIPQNALPSRFTGEKSFATGIYFLLESHHISALHRIQSDEMWHFYAGCPLDIFMIDEAGNLDVFRLGNNPENEEVFQAVVPAGVWFGSKPVLLNSYSLVGCTVAPGFDSEDFEMKSRGELLTMFPQHEEIVEMLTY